MRRSGTRDRWRPHPLQRFSEIHDDYPREPPVGFPDLTPATRFASCYALIRLVTTPSRPASPLDVSGSGIVSVSTVPRPFRLRTSTVPFTNRVRSLMLTIPSPSLGGASG